MHAGCEDGGNRVGRRVWGAMERWRARKERGGRAHDTAWEREEKGRESGREGKVGEKDWMKESYSETEGKTHRGGR